MPLHIQWQPRPWLVFVALAALIPAAALWGAALADSLGITHLLIYLPIPSTAPSRPERLLLLDAFFTVTLALPFFAAVSSVLATVAFDLRITSWEIAARVRLPAPRPVISSSGAGKVGASSARSARQIRTPTAGIKRR